MSKARKPKASKAAPKKNRSGKDAPLRIKAHYQTLSPKETADLVDALAGIVVEHVKAKGAPKPKKQRAASDNNRISEERE